MFRSFALRAAFAMAVAALVAWLFLRPDPIAMVLSADSRGVTVERRNEMLPQASGGFVLKAGDKLTVSDGGAAELANHAQTVVAEFTGPAVFVLRSPTEFQIERGGRALSDLAGSFALRTGDKIIVAEGSVAVLGNRSQTLSATLAGPASMTLQSVDDGPQLRLHSGEFSVTAHAKPGARIEAGTTVAVMDHGALTLHALSDGTRLEVESGNVRWQRLDDGREP
ncbi:MAG: hypothetical protein ABMA01_14245, partial [Chthoniobacteraceae bacterium]